MASIVIAFLHIATSCIFYAFQFEIDLQQLKCIQRASTHDLSWSCWKKSVSKYNANQNCVLMEVSSGVRLYSTATKNSRKFVQTMPHGTSFESEINITISQL